MRNSKSRNITAIAIVGSLAIAAAVYALWPAHPEPAQIGLRSADSSAGTLPLSFPAPTFDFSDQDDNSVNTQSLHGKVTIVDFIFTHCGNTCPKMTTQRVELQKLIMDPRITFLSISVDPARDDKATRKSYASANHVDEARWRFVCPPDMETALRIAQQMKIAAAGSHSHGDSPILHSDRFVLIDSAARIRGAYPITDVGAMQRLQRDANALASQIASVKK